MVWVLRRWVCGDAGACSSSDYRTGTSEAFIGASDAEAECCAGIARHRGWVFVGGSIYDFNVWTEAKRIEKLRYIHRNPVVRGPVKSPELWTWSSFRHYVSGVEGVVEIESQWTGRKRELSGGNAQGQGQLQSQNPRPVSAKPAETRTGHPVSHLDRSS